jgi:lysophospholipase L1-like esterase
MNTTGWMVGSSLVFWAESRARSNQAVGKGLTKSNIAWHGQRGMRWQQLLPKMQNKLQSAAAPTWICLHLGGNDLASIPLRALTAMALQDIKTLSNMAPNTVLIWSDVLPRVHYRGAISDAKMVKARKTFNSAIRNYITAMNGICIKHTLIQWNILMLYRPDGVHLSNRGNDIFLKDLTVCINTRSSSITRN